MEVEKPSFWESNGAMSFLRR